MSTVVNKKTFEVIQFANTPNYINNDWLINPTLPTCDKKFWVLENDVIREMTQDEKNILFYRTNSTIYLIEEKQLLENKNGYDYQLNKNAIINPIMPNCDIKYTKVVDGKIIEMSVEEKLIVDQPQKDRLESKDYINNEYEQALVDLQIIQNLTNPTNAQILLAIKKEALILEKLMRFIKFNMW